jgi:hypothetical protein
VVCGQPAALGLTDAVREVAEVSGGVRVAVDGEHHPGIARGADVVGGQVQPVGVGVHLQGGAGARAGTEQLVLADQAGQVLRGGQLSVAGLSSRAGAGGEMCPMGNWLLIPRL